MRVHITFDDFHFADHHLKMGDLVDVSDHLQSFIEETRQAIKPKSLLFCNLDDYPELDRNPDFSQALACVHDYASHKVVYLRISQNPELIVAHELGHLCVSDPNDDDWYLPDIGFSGEWPMPPHLSQFIHRTANTITDIAANKRAHARGFNVKPLFAMQLKCLLDDCRALDRHSFPCGLDIVHRAMQIASTLLFKEFFPFLWDEGLCLMRICDFYDSWTFEIRDLAKEIRDTILACGYEKREQLTECIERVLRLVFGKMPTFIDGSHVFAAYQPDKFRIPKHIRERERANSYVPHRLHLGVHIQKQIAESEYAQNTFAQVFHRASEAEKLFLQGQEAFRLGLLEDAQKKVASALQHISRHKPAYHLLGRIALQRGDLDTAKMCFLVALEMPTQYLLAYEHFATTAFEAGDHRFTARNLLGLAKLDRIAEGLHRVHEYIGRSSLALGEKKLAALAFENARRTNRVVAAVEAPRLVNSASL